MADMDDKEHMMGAILAFAVGLCFVLMMGDDLTGGAVPGGFMLLCLIFIGCLVLARMD